MESVGALINELADEIKGISRSVREMSSQLCIPVRPPAWMEKGVLVGRETVYYDCKYHVIMSRTENRQSYFSWEGIKSTLRGPGDTARLIRFLQRTLVWWQDRGRGLLRAREEMMKQQRRHAGFVDTVAAARVLGGKR